MRFSATVILTGMIAFSLLLPGCARPPFEEIKNAQAAIDSAKAVGAEKYASVDYVMACDSLKTGVTIMNKQKPWILFGNSFERTKKCLVQAVQCATNARIKAITEKNRIKAKADSIEAVVSASLFEIKKTVTHLKMKKDDLKIVLSKIAQADSLLTAVHKHSTLEDYGTQKSLGFGAMVTIDTLQVLLKNSEATSKSKGKNQKHIGLAKRT